MVAGKIEAYLRHRIPLGELRNWVENKVARGDFDSPESPLMP
jgi:hypothetical protein